MLPEFRLPEAAGLSLKLCVSAQRGPDYRQLLTDAQLDLERQRKESDEHAALLREEAASAQKEASAARAEARLAASGAHCCCLSSLH